MTRSRITASRRSTTIFARVAKDALTVEQRQLAATDEVFATWADETVAYMKQAHPWTNRTTKAEEGLAWRWRTWGYADKGKRLELRHGVWYGKFLELAHGGKWAIIIPTLASSQGSALLRQRLQALWGK